MQTADVELPITYRGAVYPWNCDHMGHMNVMWYVSKFDEATWQVFGLLGLNSSFLQKHHRLMAGVQQNISYKRELHAGDIITIRSGILEIKDRVVRFFHEMTNDETGKVSAVAELTVVHMDSRTRKACSFPKQVLSRGKQMIVKHDFGK